MKSSFKQIVLNKFDRNFGGTVKGTADPYLSGYHFIWFSVLPSALPAAIGVTNPAELGSVDEIKSVLSAACQSVTPPGGTLNSTDFPALGGTKWGVPTSVDYGNTVSVKFLEYSSLPILTILHGWVRMIRDYRTGASILVGDNYGKSKYAGTMFYWTTKPDGQTIEDYECYVGMYPGRDPRELYSGDIATVDKLEVEVEFHVDKAYHEDWVKQYCQSKANSFFNEGKNFHGWSTTHPQTETQT